jgi:uncharacterized repeat protein (TIGR01451 family)
MQARKELWKKLSWLGVTLLTGLLLAIAILLGARDSAQKVRAAPIPPPEGYPKFITSMKVVTPTLADTSGATLNFQVEIRNTGAYAAPGTTLTDQLPANGTFLNAEASAGPTPQVNGGVLTWNGEVGFDSMVVISYSLQMDSGISGLVENLAVIDNPQISEPVTVTAVALLADGPVLEISKSSEPAHPGPNQPLTYTLTVTNLGQTASGISLSVQDNVPADTTLLEVGTSGTASPNRRNVTWNRNVTLDTGDSEVFTYSVTVNDVVSGTVITNGGYQVSASGVETAIGEPVTTTVIDPVLSVYKQITPDPPGANQVATYTLTVLNTGSRASDLVVSDEVPDGVTYLSGGDSYSNGTVRWNLPAIGTLETAQFSYMVSVPDVAEVPVLNQNYSVCVETVICTPGDPLTSVVQGPVFEVEAMLDPIAKKPGGGGGTGNTTEVTPTLLLRNLGPGNALDANVLLKFNRISISNRDVLTAYDSSGPVGIFSDAPDCGENCRSYGWVGDVAAGSVITFTTIEPQSTIGGEEGTIYSTTLVVTDVLGTYVTEPISGTAEGIVTHFSNLLPNKSAPETIGRGEWMTYTIVVRNSGLSVDTPPPYPLLTDTVPMSVSVVSISDGGTSSGAAGGTTVSWMLPALSTGEVLTRSYVVQVADDLVSGTQIVNDGYMTSWNEGSTVLTNTGSAVTTTVIETGLIDSFKVVTPTFALPGADNLLTYYLHLANSSAYPLDGVHIVDWLPWEHTTYRRDAVASSGSIISDIVSLDWNGNIAPHSENVVTFTVKVDPDFEGVITNTAVIDHESLLEPLTLTAVAYITDEPVLQITKTAAPDPVKVGEDLEYTLKVTNLAQTATNLELYDTVPRNTEYVPWSATAGGTLVGDQIQWEFPILGPGESQEFKYKVTAGNTRLITNDDYGVTCAQGVSATGEPVTTPTYGRSWNYLPVLLR